MIVLDLLGGLGNQLFVWAAGRALEFNGQEVAYCTCKLKSDKGRRYLLGDLGLKLNIIDRHVGHSFTVQKPGYDPVIFSLKGDWTLHGYFQSEKYWSADVQEAIRREVFGDLILREETLHVAEGIRDDDCFVHVRRSDNLSARGLAFHGLTSAPESMYYHRADQIMRCGGKFFVFSDDPTWCRRYGTLLDWIVVDCNAPSFTVDDRFDLTKNDQGREVEDLWLMSLFKHAICANSSFSWWAAWLGNIPDVIVPDPWFSDPRGDSTDIVPERWLKVNIK